MSISTDCWNRRRFLQRAALVGASRFIGLRPELALAEPPPEMTKIRLPQTPAMCEAPQYVVGDLLKAEGFSAVEYVKIDISDPSDSNSLEKLLASGAIQIGFNFAAPAIIRMESGDPITLLTGVHPGCFELFGTDRVRAIRDLRRKKVAINRLGVAQHVYLASMVAYVGMDPRKDVNFVAYPAAEGKRGWTPTSDFPPTPKSCGPRESVTSSSIARSTDPGPSTFVAWWSGTGSSCASIRWRRSVPCAPS